MKHQRPIPRLGLSRSELAQSIGVSVGSIDAMVTEGALPPPRIWHRRKIWIVSEVESAMFRWPGNGDSQDDWPEPPHFTPVSWDETPPRKALGGHAIPTGPDDPLQKWYDKIGFDPRTMNNDDMKRLMAKAEEEWDATIPFTAMTMLEKTSLVQLLNFGVGVPAKCALIKGCGADTSDRLRARGFITWKMREKFPDRVEAYVLTESGHEAASELHRNGFEGNALTRYWQK